MDYKTACQMANSQLLAYSCLRYEGFIVSKLHVAISDALMKVVSGEEDRLMIFTPPRHGKSHTTSGDFPAYYLGRNPNHHIISGSYNKDLATDFGRAVRDRMIDEEVYRDIFPGVELKTDSKAANHFVITHPDITQSGVYNAVGVGGAATGRGAHLFLIDDPIKGREEAESEAYMKRLKNWYRSTAYTRLMPQGGAIVLIQTRWHHDDLAGWLLREHADENWKVLDLQAIFEPDETNKGVDPLGRSPGEALWPEMFDTERLARIRKAIGEREWQSLYQQRPSLDEGNILQRKWWRKWPTLKPLPRCKHIIQSYDTAFSEQDIKRNSYSARTTWGIFWNEQEGRHCMLLLEAWKDRADYPTLRKKAKADFKEWNPDRVLIEKKASGQSLIQDLRMANVPVSVYNPDKSKTTRAYAVSAMLESGQIWYPDRQWANDVIDECAQFPTGVDDDFVDTCTQAWLWLRNGWWATHPDDASEDGDIPDNVVPIKPAYGGT